MPHQSESKEQALRICKDLLTEAENVLHPENYQILKTVDKISDICIELGQWQEAVTFCKKSLDGYLKYYPKFHPSTAIQLYRTGRSEDRFLRILQGNSFGQFWKPAHLVNEILSRNVLTIHFLLGKLEVYLDMIDAGISALTRAQSLLDVCYGKQHPLNVQLNELILQTLEEKKIYERLNLPLLEQQWCRLWKPVY